MPLSNDEQRCVDATCVLLAHQFGGSWRVAEGESLDDLHPNLKSPEVLIANGTLTAAVEVTELRGGSVWNEHGISWRTLQTVLQPNRQGHFLLVPSDDFRLPITKAMVRQLKKQVGVAAETLVGEGDSTVIRVPRSAVVSLANSSGPGYVYCCHDSLFEVLREASNGIEGTFMLVDCSQGEHSFHTEAGRSAAAERIAEGCRQRLAGEGGRADWDEEWKLYLLDPLGSGVEILSATKAVSVPDMVSEDVTRAVRTKSQKFAAKRWADLHILVLDARFSLASADHATFALSHVPEQQLSEFDLVALAHGTNIESIWGKPPV